ncbi:MAG TPA: ABC transporter transmembrane domain-containing protein [Thermoanaerobaculia bacterium]|nr:ABC transporter transmembrane domain-containing protein [Thermoanaerobaculia bacterium]HUM31264.1 ABC transporter transmembrane domain-containing protein [Thermoanaerobaculia bacterium]HXK69609.1 ABC transporter transmembrane domain-containing protein [Thermoanaerobaculia bacterium]
MKNIFRMLRFAKTYWVWAVMALMGMLLVSAFATLQAYLIKPLFDDLLLGGSQGPVDSAGIVQWLDSLYAHTITWFKGMGVSERPAVAILIFVVMIFNNFFMFLSHYSFAVVGLSMVQDIRKFLYRRLTYMPLRFFSLSSTGELVSRIISDVLFIESAMAERLGDIVQESIKLLGLLLLIVSINMKLSAFALIIAPLTLYPIIRFSRSLRKSSRRSQEEMARMAGLLTETFQGSLIVKAFNAENHENNRFLLTADRHLHANLRARLVQSISAPVIETLGIMLALGMFLYAGHEISQGRMSIGEFSSFLGAIFMMYAPIKKLNKVNLALQQASVAADRVFALTDMEDEFIADGTRPFPGVSEEITFEDVRFLYTEEKGEVLRGVTFQVKRGQVIAIVGSSGAGKSTLSLLLPRFYDATAGRIAIDGVDIQEFQKQSLRDKMGIVTQQTILFNDTVLSNIAYASPSTDPQKVREAAKAAYALEFIENLPRGFDTIIGESGVTLSGGQRQRLSIARALAKDPPILILDEATSSLDSESETLVQKALDTLMVGRTTLVIAHRLSTVKHADKIIVLDNGRVIEEGTHTELMARGGHYAGMVRMQMFEEA